MFYVMATEIGNGAHPESEFYKAAGWHYEVKRAKRSTPDYAKLYPTYEAAKAQAEYQARADKRKGLQLSEAS